MPHGIASGGQRDRPRNEARSTERPCPKDREMPRLRVASENLLDYKPCVPPTRRSPRSGPICLQGSPHQGSPPTDATASLENTAAIDERDKLDFTVALSEPLRNVLSVVEFYDGQLCSDAQ